MNDKQTAEKRRKAIEHLNSKKVLGEVKLWITLTILCIAGLSLALVFGPRIDDFFTGLEWEYQLGSTLTFLILIYLYIRNKTK